LLLIARFLSHYYVNSNDEYNLSHIFKLGTKFKEFNNAYNQTTIEHNNEYAEEGYLKIVLAYIGDTIIAKLISFIAVHILIVAIVNCLLEGPQKFYFYKNCIFCYLLPVIARFLEVSPYYLEIIQNSSSVLIFLSLIQYFYYRLPNLFSQIKSYYAQLIWQTEHNGILSFIASTLSRVFVPTYFLLFWIIAFTMKYYEHNQFYRKPNTNWYLNLLIVISNVCTSPISLIATSVTITYISCAILFAVKVYLHGLSTKKFNYLRQSTTNSTTANQQSTSGQSDVSTNDQNAAQQRQNAIYNESHTGYEEGLTTLLLAVLTGLTELKQTARMAVLTIILFAVLSSLLQSMLEIAEPVVLSLSTHHGKSMIHHVKIIFFCGFLFTFPLYITWVLAQVFPVDFWLAIVLSTSVLTSAQVLDLFIIHCLLWYDATRDEPWTPLDEVVYVIRGIVKIIEFIIAVSVVMAGIYEASFNRFSWISIMILIVHAYFNVIQRLNQGFRSYVKRRHAATKSNQLPNATREQLEKLNDVCSICFVDLNNENTSVVTKCNHYFHRVCLRRSLSFKDCCPVCRSKDNL